MSFFLSEEKRREEKYNYSLMVRFQYPVPMECFQECLHGQNANEYNS